MVDPESREPDGSLPASRAPFHRRQLVALVQIAIVWIVCVLAYVYGPSIAPGPATTDLGGRLSFLAGWLLVPALVLLATVMVTMCVRFLSPSAIDGTRAPASRFLEINLRVTQNTLEQSVLAIVAWFGLALTLPPGRLDLIPVAASLFGIGRILFWAGYQLRPLARAIGFGLTFVPTVAALVWVAVRAIAPS
jgi:hypothetical protein